MGDEIMVENLKKLRNELGISQQYLADKIGVSQQSINKYENHGVEPDITTLISIADFFNVTVDYLIGRTSDKSNTSDKLTEPERYLIREYKKLSLTEKTCIKAVITEFNKAK